MFERWKRSRTKDQRKKGKGSGARPLGWCTPAGRGERRGSRGHHLGLGVGIGREGQGERGDGGGAAGRGRWRTGGKGRKSSARVALLLMLFLGGKARERNYEFLIEISAQSSLNTLSS